MDFLNYISNNYNSLKNDFKTLLYVKFDEDVFHTTIYKCYNSIIKNNINLTSENEIKAYFINSYKNNVIRNKQYYDNKPKDDVYEIDIASYNDFDMIYDINYIYELILSKFGIEMFNIFNEYNNGDTSIAKLQESHSNIKNLKQKIKNIKIYIKKFRDAENASLK